MTLACLENGIISEDLEERVLKHIDVLRSSAARQVVHEAKAALYSVISSLANTGHFESAVDVSSKVFSLSDDMTKPLYAMTAAIRMNSLIETGNLAAAKEIFGVLRSSSVKMSERAFPFYLNNIGIAARFFEPGFALNCFQEALEISKDSYTSAMIRTNLLYYLYAVGREFDDNLFVSDYDPTDVANAIDDLRLIFLLENSSYSKQRVVADRLRVANEQIPVRQNAVQTHAYLGHYYLETSDTDHAKQELHQTIQILNKQFSVFRFGESAFLASRIYYRVGEFARSLLTLLLARECLESNRLFCRFHRHLYSRINDELEEKLLGSTKKPSRDEALSLDALVSELIKAASFENGEDRIFLGESLWEELLARRSSTIHLIPPLSRRIMCGVSEGFNNTMKCSSISEKDILANLPENSEFITPRSLEKLTALVEALFAPGKPR